MAPVKRSTVPAQRETRATRAAAVAKKKTTALEKKADTLTTSRSAATVDEPKLANRRVKIAISSGKVEQPHEQEVTKEHNGENTHSSSIGTRATRATVSSTSLAAAPRRRIKVTTLATPNVDTATTKELIKPTKSNTKDATATKRTSTRSNSTVAEPQNEVSEEILLVEPKPRSTRKATSNSKTGSETKSAPAPKPRGRPKLQKLDTVEPSTGNDLETATTLRATRSQRANSTMPSEVSAEVAEESKTVKRKKVTFQDLPHENDKENQPLPETKTKSSAKKASVSTATATGLRAKPLRKAASSSTTVRTRKASSSAASGSSVVADKSIEGIAKKRMPRVLTPKKITQVAKSNSPEHGEQEISDEEDELNGGKTPIRDLSLSPRRPATAALARALSPVKKIDFTQSVMPKSPDRTAVFRDDGMEHTGMLTSPARRPAASPLKETMHGSPKRGLSEGAKLLFPAQIESGASIALNVTTGNPSSQAMSHMLQSPKRVGVLDPSFFSQSAMKKSSSKSPFKSSLFGTPAKRLFSPAKKSSTPLVPNMPEVEEGCSEEGQYNEAELESEVSASSHFRSSSSPLRPLRIDPNSEGMDFDDSVLQIRSPLKVNKSPLKMSVQPCVGVTENDTESISEPEETTHVLDAQEPSQTVEKESNESTVGHEVQFEADSTAHELPDSVIPSDVEMTEEEQVVNDSRPQGVTRRPSMSQFLFRSTKTAQDDSSEDELASEQTPMRTHVQRRSGNLDPHSHSRLSTGVPNSAIGKGFGFTPLAVQMSGWLASSPEKSPQRQGIHQEDQTMDFSPVARQHVDGEVIISRDSTPVQKLSKRLSSYPESALKSAVSARKSKDLRKSLIQRRSLGLVSSTESPARNPQFEEYMEIRAIEEQFDAENMHAEFEIENNDQAFDEIMELNGQAIDANEGDDTIMDDNETGSDVSSTEQAGDLTTDLIKFTHATDTAMIDFQLLANEAEQLASDGTDNYTTELIDEDDIARVDNDEIIDQDATLATGQVEVALELEINSPVTEDEAQVASVLHEEIEDVAQSPQLRAIDAQLDSPSMLDINRRSSPVSSSSSAIHSSAASPAALSVINTPNPNLKVNERRIINTVVSKVPLKPEGLISPIKMPRKRSRSFGNSDISPAKRISFENLKSIQPSKDDEMIESPNRRVRTSVAPSPGGTSTPATSKSNMTATSRMSFGGYSAQTTPGQISFVVDDFGDSTLDGIELPDDYEDTTQIINDEESPAKSAYSESLASGATTPKANPAVTPATARRSNTSSATPVTATRKTPKTIRKTPARPSADTAAERTPLRPVGKGVLHGATVFVDVHTSEGADASGIFVELLSQMGAKCVKEWRWNPRASLAPIDDTETAEQKIGITHVVFKDGGKRTLEKVRDAKGEVCCVGVAWVLDCERENKWLDESSYTIDTNILPRGGSKRRKSMEPRALLVAEDGSVSASRPRRSVSAEMTELMKRELVNTPARGSNMPANVEEDQEGDDDENLEQATPTGFISYDPRVAMTPATPYLVSQGKKLTQMSAPPKQQNKSLFEDEDEENDSFLGGEKGDSKALKDAKKFRMKNLGDISKRRRTLGFKPTVGSPLGRS